MVWGVLLAVAAATEYFAFVDLYDFAPLPGSGTREDGVLRVGAGVEIVGPLSREDLIGAKAKVVRASGSGANESPGRWIVQLEPTEHQKKYGTPGDELSLRPQNLRTATGWLHDVGSFFKHAFSPAVLGPNTLPPSPRAAVVRTSMLEREVTAAGAAHVLAQGEGEAAGVFSHSDLSLCRAGDFSDDDRAYLAQFVGAAVPAAELAAMTTHPRAPLSCQLLGYGFAPRPGDEDKDRPRPCTTVACGVYGGAVPLTWQNSQYGAMTKVLIGLADIEAALPAPARDDAALFLRGDLERRTDQWRASDYHVLTHNCNTFVQYVAECLLGVQLPFLGMNHFLSSGSRKAC